MNIAIHFPLSLRTYRNVPVRVDTPDPVHIKVIFDAAIGGTSPKAPVMLLNARGVSPGPSLR